VAPLPIPAPRNAGEVIDLATLDHDGLAKLRANLDLVAGAMIAARREVDNHILAVMGRENTGTLSVGGWTLTRRRPSGRNIVDADQLFTELAILEAEGKLSADAVAAACTRRTVTDYTWSEVKKLTTHDDPEVRRRIQSCVTYEPGQGDPTLSVKHT
jgi:hypothetical protein